MRAIFFKILIILTLIYSFQINSLIAQTPTPMPERYVSPSGSNDPRFGDGSYDKPWKTITHACKTAPFYAKIFVEPGEYKYWDPGADPGGSGEVFPILPDKGQQIIGAIGTIFDEKYACIVNAEGNPEKCRVFEIVRSDITIANLKITKGFPVAGDGGGGIYIHGPVENIFIENNLIVENRGHTGAGIRIDSTGTVNYSIIIRNNIISGNTQTISLFDGGGINIGNSSPIIENNTIENNTAYHGGGINIDCGKGFLHKCKSDEIQGYVSRVIIRNNIIRYNKVITNPLRTLDCGGDGGGIRLDHCTYAIIDGNTIEKNEAIFGAGIVLEFNASAIISNNVISGNIVRGNWMVTGEESRAARIGISGVPYPWFYLQSST